MDDKNTSFTKSIRPRGSNPRLEGSFKYIFLLNCILCRLKYSPDLYFRKFYAIGSRFAKISSTSRTFKISWLALWTFALSRKCVPLKNRKKGIRGNEWLMPKYVYISIVLIMKINIFRGPFIFAVERFLHFTDFYFRGLSLTVHQNHAILSIILQFADFYFHGKRSVISHHQIMSMGTALHVFLQFTYYHSPQEITFNIQVLI